MRSVSVSGERLERWIDGFELRHGGSARVTDGALELVGADGASATVHPLFAFVGDDLDSFVRHVQSPPRSAVLLVRRGGFAAAVVDSGVVEASATGRRHVQGRTAAGGWSQQRFARRRVKQTDELVDAAVQRAADTILTAAPAACLVTGGDRALVQQALGDARLRALAALPRGPHLAVPDPRRDVVAELPTMLTVARVDLVDP